MEEIIDLYAIERFRGYCECVGDGCDCGKGDIEENGSLRMIKKIMSVDFVFDILKEIERIHS